MICPKLPGKHPQTTSKQQCQIISAALAQFHNFTEASPQNFTGLRSIDWLATLVSSGHTALSASDQAHVYATMKQFEQIKTLPMLRKGLCHGDLFRDNCLFNGHKLQAILDFYSASEHFYLFDLAVLINDWAHNQGIDTVKQQAIITAYQTVRPLTWQEQEQLPFFLRLAAMRFWLSRVLETQKAPRSTGEIKPFQAFRELYYQLSD